MVGMGIYVSYTKPTEREVLMDEETFYCLLSVACSAAVKLDVLTVECSVSVYTLLHHGKGYLM